MTGLAERLEATRPATRGTPCSVGVVLDQLDDTDRATLIAWLANPTVTARQIIDALAPDHELRDSSLGRHRRGGCRCDPGTGQVPRG